MLRYDISVLFCHINRIQSRCSSDSQLCHQLSQGHLGLKKFTGTLVIRKEEIAVGSLRELYDGIILDIECEV